MLRTSRFFQPFCLCLFVLFVGPIASPAQPLPPAAIGGPQEAAVTAEQPAQASRAHPLKNVVFIGASLSAGFGNYTELEVSNNVKLGGFFEATYQGVVPESETHDYGTSRFFLSPYRLGPRQIDRAIKDEPTLVVGVDFLFWFACGFDTESRPRRLGGLERGLKLLEKIDGPLVIGDIPNVQHALKGQSPLRGGEPVVHPAQLPSEAERVAMNKVIYAWAAERDHVKVFPLAEMIDRMRAKQPIELRGNTWPIQSLDEALQTDLLHPKVRGMVWVSLFLADVCTQFEGIDAQHFEWSETVLRERVWASLEGQRAKLQKKRERLAKKKAEREAKAKEEVGSR